GQVAAAWIADYQAVRADLDLGAKSIGVQPIDADQQIESIRKTLDRPTCQPDQRRRLATADLRTHGAREQAVPSGSGRGLEQQVARSERAGSAAADDGDGEVFGFRHVDSPRLQGLVQAPQTYGRRPRSICLRSRNLQSNQVFCSQCGGKTAIEGGFRNVDRADPLDDDG